MTGAGDETLRFWNVFSKARSQKVGIFSTPVHENLERREGGDGKFSNCQFDFKDS